MCRVLPEPSLLLPRRRFYPTPSSTTCKFLPSSYHPNWSLTKPYSFASAIAKAFAVKSFRSLIIPLNLQGFLAYLTLSNGPRPPYSSLKPSLHACLFSFTSLSLSMVALLFLSPCVSPLSSVSVLALLVCRSYSVSSSSHHLLRGELILKVFSLSFFSLTSLSYTVDPSNCSNQLSVTLAIPPTPPNASSGPINALRVCSHCISVQ